MNKDTSKRAAATVGSAAAGSAVGAAAAAMAPGMAQAAQPTTDADADITPEPDAHEPEPTHLTAAPTPDTAAHDTTPVPEPTPDTPTPDTDDNTLDTSYIIDSIADHFPPVDTMVCVYGGPDLTDPVWHMYDDGLADPIDVVHPTDPTEQQLYIDTQPDVYGGPVMPDNVGPDYDPLSDGSVMPDDTDTTPA